MGYYWVYYLAVLVAYFAVDHPAVLLIIAVFIVARRWVPDPWVFLRSLGHIRRLKAQIQANPSNVTARRDLARIYLDRLRPKTALRLVEEARTRDPESAELLFLRGLALHRSGQHERALEPLVEAVQRDARVGFGEAYLVAGDALTELRRHEEAVDAYEHYVEANTSSIQGWTKVGLARRRLGEDNGATDAFREASDTWQQLPGFSRRKQVAWFLRVQFHRAGL